MNTYGLSPVSRWELPTNSTSTGIPDSFSRQYQSQRHSVWLFILSSTNIRLFSRTMSTHSTMTASTVPRSSSALSVNSLALPFTFFPALLFFLSAPISVKIENR